MQYEMWIEKTKKIMVCAGKRAVAVVNRTEHIKGIPLFGFLFLSLKEKTINDLPFFDDFTIVQIKYIPSSAVNCEMTKIFLGFFSGISHIFFRSEILINFPYKYDCVIS